MMQAQLSNPIWHSLQGAHHRFAMQSGELRWYPPTVAPFVALADANAVADLDAAVHAGLKLPAYFAGVLPTMLPHRWLFSARSQVLQMLPSPDARLSVDDADMRVLQDADRPSMLQLAQAAFPDYFRERTAELGVYLGIFLESKLVAMAGERMALEGLREISGVCTHPDFQGRGFAKRLTLALLARHRQSGIASFLHVSESNTTARRLYESMGFAVCSSVELGKVEQET